MTALQTLFLSLFVLVGGACAWLSQPLQVSSSSRSAFQKSSSCSSGFQLFGIRNENKFYQLVESEDAATCATEVYLMADRTVDFGKTDGPVPESVEGVWDVVPGTDNFIMTIRKCFSTGSSGSDMGEFSFEILREYKGDMTMIGESVAITGVMINKDEILGDKEVGYFNMVDDTKERESYTLEGRFKFEIDFTKGMRLSEKFPSLHGMFATVNWEQLGPGDLDPNEVFAMLPEDMARSFEMQNFEMLESILQRLPREEAEYYIKGCIDSGLWLTEEQASQMSQEVGPGGLDPMEVWASLPPLMQTAFENQDITMLETVLSNMPTEEADYHMKRCEASGLWG